MPDYSQVEEEENQEREQRQVAILVWLLLLEEMVVVHSEGQVLKAVAQQPAGKVEETDWLFASHPTAQEIVGKKEVCLSNSVVWAKWVEA